MIPIPPSPPLPLAQANQPAPTTATLVSPLPPQLAGLPANSVILANQPTPTTTRGIVQLQTADGPILVKLAIPLPADATLQLRLTGQGGGSSQLRIVSINGQSLLPGGQPVAAAVAGTGQPTTAAPASPRTDDAGPTVVDTAEQSSETGILATLVGASTDTALPNGASFTVRVTSFQLPGQAGETASQPITLPPDTPGSDPTLSTPEQPAASTDADNPVPRPSVAGADITGQPTSAGRPLPLPSADPTPPSAAGTVSTPAVPPVPSRPADTAPPPPVEAVLAPPTNAAQIPSASLPAPPNQAGPIPPAAVVPAPGVNDVPNPSVAAVSTPPANIVPPSSVDSVPTPPANAAAVTSESAAQPLPPTLSGVVAPNSQFGQPLVQTPIGLLSLNVALPAGTQITLTTLGPVTLPAGPSPEEEIDSPMPSSPTGWATLDEILDSLRQADPQGSQPLSHHLATAGSADAARLAPALMTLAAAVQSGDPAAWLGQAAIKSLLRLGRRDLVSRLVDELGEMKARVHLHGAGQWLSLILPLPVGHQIERVRLMIRRPPEDDAEAAARAEEGARFLLDIDMSRLGPLQLDGLVIRKAKRFDLVLRSHEPLPEDMRREIGGIFSRALEGLDMTGKASFQTAANFIEPLPPPKRRSAGWVI